MTQDTIKTSIIGELAMALARIYKQHVWPGRYDRIFYLDGIRVRVTMEEYKGLDDTQPVRTLEREPGEWVD